MQDSYRSRLLIVSNRLPLKVVPRADGKATFEPGSGGLVTALAPVLRDRGGTWIGWPGVDAEKAPDNLPELMEQAGKKLGYRIRPVALKKKEVKLFYEGFSNEVLWPIFHDFPSVANFDPKYWDAYRAVNRKYAEAIAEHGRPGDFIWIHDYQLMLVAEECRKLGVDGLFSFFLHIPFPSLGMFLKIPWRTEILRGLLAYDLLGVQTAWDRRNLMECVRSLIPEVVWRGRGRVASASLEGRDVRIGDFPISIDYRGFMRQAKSEPVLQGVRAIRKNLDKRTIILGVDRLDYTKGILYRLGAFYEALVRYPELREKTTLVQVAVPSRTAVPQYKRLRARIERMVGRINGQFTRPGWIPVHYIFRSLSREELLSYYRAADIALVTPLKDGMNLIAKEYCVTNVDNDGVLILSEFAGAASQLQIGALLVNPFDVVGTADAIFRACKMAASERKSRMRKMRAAIRKQDVFWWVDSFLRSAIAKDLSEFPALEEYSPLAAGEGVEAG